MTVYNVCNYTHTNIFFIIALCVSRASVCLSYIQGGKGGGDCVSQRGEKQFHNSRVLKKELDVSSTLQFVH